MALLRSPHVLALVAAAALAAAPAAARAQATRTGVLEVSAWIDGISNLQVTPTAIAWQHEAWCAPGLLGSSRMPTKVTLDGRPITWCPVWANGCDTCAGTCGELRDQAMASRPLALPVLPGRLRSFTFSCMGRDGCTLEQSPEASNGNTALVRFDDGPSPGAEWYTARLEYTYDCDGCAPDASPLNDAGADAATDAAAPLDAPPPPPGARTAADLARPDVAGPDEAAETAPDGGQGLGALAHPGCDCALPGHPRDLPAPAVLAVFGALALVLGRRRDRAPSQRRHRDCHALAHALDLRHPAARAARPRAGQPSPADGGPAGGEALGVVRVADPAGR